MGPLCPKRCYNSLERISKESHRLGFDHGSTVIASPCLFQKPLHMFHEHELFLSGRGSPLSLSQRRGILFCSCSSELPWKCPPWKGLSNAHPCLSGPPGTIMIPWACWFAEVILTQPKRHLALDPCSLMLFLQTYFSLASLDSNISSQSLSSPNLAVLVILQKQTPCLWVAFSALILLCFYTPGTEAATP